MSLIFYPFNFMFDFSNFRFIKTIGVGTFGRVYLSHLANNPKKFYAVKILSHYSLLKLRQIDHFQNEIRLLALCKKHPFIVDLIYTARINDHFVMLMEYVPGGELFSWIKKYRKFNLEIVKFFSAQIALALDFLHSRGIIYRDLKPENLMLNSDGYLKLTDFGFAKETDLTYSFCGTPEYMAPEQLINDENIGHGREVDFWSFGVVIYEMYVGIPPFYCQETFKIYKKIAEEEVNFYGFIPELEDLLSKLLIKDKTKRLGAKGGFKEIMNHKFFNDVDWEKIYRKEIQPPFKPILNNDWDTSYFINYSENIERESKERNNGNYCRFF